METYLYVTKGLPMDTSSSFPMVSIIMPVYNSEKYVNNTILTILRQTYHNFELLLINDGSTDQSGTICDNWAVQDSRVRVFHKSNGGICSARNLGLKHAKGKYIAFCDNDDEYANSLLEDNIKIALNGNYDVVRFLRKHLYLINDKIVNTSVISIDNALSINSSNILENYFEVYRLLIGGVWNGLYKRQFLEKAKITFNESYKFKFGQEDIYFNLQVLLSTCNIYINPKIYYYWTERKSHSTSRKFSYERFEAIEECWKLEKQLNQKYRIEETYPTKWAIQILGVYISRVLQFLTRPECKMTHIEKINYLFKIRQDNLFQFINNGQDIQTQEMDFKTKIIYYLFMNNQMRLLLSIYAIYARLYIK